MLTVALAPWGDEARLRACHLVVAGPLPASSAVAPHTGRVVRCIEVTLAGTPSYYLDPSGDCMAAAAQAAAAMRPFSSEYLDILVPPEAVAMVLEDHQETILGWARALGLLAGLVSAVAAAPEAQGPLAPAPEPAPGEATPAAPAKAPRRAPAGQGPRRGGQGTR